MLSLIGRCIASTSRLHFGNASFRPISCRAVSIRQGHMELFLISRPNERSPNGGSASRTSLIFTSAWRQAGTKTSSIRGSRGPKYFCPEEHPRAALEAEFESGNVDRAYAAFLNAAYYHDADWVQAKCIRRSHFANREGAGRCILRHCKSLQPYEKNWTPLSLFRLSGRWRMILTAMYDR